ncbi:MAG: VIT1/CCC1 transporter family protein [Phycisphaerae bacterium]|nr:VIT1/CCC1 transporter family protein [Phycisphaerae bacterium]
MNEKMKRALIQAQRNEITEHHVYLALAKRQRDEHNRRVLERIAADEKKHYEFWGEHTGLTPPPNRTAVWKYTWLARLFGLTFAVKFMEKGEEKAQAKYGDFASSIPEAEGIARDEHEHENELTNMIDEERLRYVGSIVLGLNDALVELTGALAGFTLALRDSRLIAVIGLITGVAAALSMGASEYLSTKAEAGHGRTPGKAAVYTTIAYIFTVAVLVGPFLLLGNPLFAMGVTLTGALVIIMAFTYYVSIAQDVPFRKRFLEMAGLSLGVAAVSFGIGYLLQRFVGVDV